MIVLIELEEMHLNRTLQTLQKQNQYRPKTEPLNYIVTVITTVTVDGQKLTDEAKHCSQALHKSYRLEAFKNKNITSLKIENTNRYFITVQQMSVMQIGTEISSKGLVMKVTQLWIVD